MPNPNPLSEADKALGESIFPETVAATITIKRIDVVKTPEGELVGRYALSHPDMPQPILIAMSMSPGEKLSDFAQGAAMDIALSAHLSNILVTAVFVETARQADAGGRPAAKSSGLIL